jgi:hypothetical protein
MSESDDIGDGRFDPQALFRLKEEMDAADTALKASFPALDAARRRYARSRSPEDKQTLEAAQAETGALFEVYKALLGAIRDMLGITEDELAEIEAERVSGSHHIPRAALTADRIEPTADLWSQIGDAVQTVEALLPKGWLDEEPADSARLDPLFGPDGVLSITKGLRPESEMPAIHRFRQAVYTARDYRDGHMAYDHFAGATQAPTIVQLAAQLTNLRAVGGDVEQRLSRLWTGPGPGVDATALELFTAAGCAARGRKIAFLPETKDKSPDLTCEDPFPLVIECKRQAPLSDYEIGEERLMRALFIRLRQLTRARGVAGAFELRLTVEAKDLDLDDVAAAIFRQRLAAHAERPLAYPWGTVAFRELPRRGVLPEETRAYSPTMLEKVFGWNTDLPEWDGLVCSIANAKGGSVLDVQSPVGLLWSNAAPEAMRKRTWAPANLFGSATSQIVPGATGIVYVAYVEGARAEAADMRVAAYEERLREWEHGGDIRVPISVLCRLYPRPLEEGEPDLIESSVRLVSSVYGDPSFFDDFPSNVFTQLDSA